MAEVEGRRPVRDRIIEAAMQLLVTHGRDGVSTRSVAAAAGTQAPTIYRLFGDKAGLLAAVVERGYASYLAVKPRPGGGEVDAVAELRAGWDLHVEFGLANPALFALMYGDPQPDRSSPSARAGFRLLAARIHTLAAAGRLRVGEQRATDMVHAAATGVVMTLLAAPADRRDPGLSGATFGAVIRAVTVDVPPTGPGDPEPGPVPAANTLRAALPDLDALTAGERHVLGEWLARIVG